LTGISIIEIKVERGEGVERERGECGVFKMATLALIVWDSGTVHNPQALAPGRYVQYIPPPLIEAPWFSNNT
jgi:hypothetical protein